MNKETASSVSLQSIPAQIDKMAIGILFLMIAYTATDAISIAMLSFTVSIIGCLNINIMDGGDSEISVAIQAFFSDVSAQTDL